MQRLTSSSKNPPKAQSLRDSDTINIRLEKDLTGKTYSNLFFAPNLLITPRNLSCLTEEPLMFNRGISHA